MIGWLTVPGTAHEGPIFEFIDGVFLDGVRMPNVVAEMLDCIERLHADAGLAFCMAMESRTHSLLANGAKCLLTGWETHGCGICNCGGSYEVVPI